MQLIQDVTNICEGRAMLDQLPSLYFAVLKNTQIERKSQNETCYSFDLPVLGKRIKTASNAREAVRAILIELTDVLTKTSPDEWPADWRALTQAPLSTSSTGRNAEALPRFQSKPRQVTVGITMPATLKSAVQKMADQQQESFAEVARRVVSLGFDSFDERTFFESSAVLLEEMTSITNEWSGSERVQVMLRLEPDIAIRIRASAKEYRRSASEFGASCLAYGLVLQGMLIQLDERASDYKGSRIRGLATKIGIDSHPALLSGVLAGSIVAPKQILLRLSAVFEAPQYVLATYLKGLFARRAIPSFKAKNVKPGVIAAAVSWREAVNSLNLPMEMARELLRLDE